MATKQSGGPEGSEPTRAEIEALPGPVLLEFGASWCPHCQGLEPALSSLLDEFPTVRWIWVEDGKGKPLGRSFRVKLWPNLVFLKAGQVVMQLARPSPEQVRRGLEAIAAPGGARSEPD